MRPSLLIPLLLLSTASALASPPPPNTDNCPQPPGFTDRNCDLIYVIPATLSPAFADAAITLTEAETGSDDPRCAPHLADLARQVQWDWFKPRCKHATLDAVRDIVEAGNNDKVFCRKTDPNTYQLFDKPAIRDFVVAELRKSRPDLCR
jgi:hypothetical protein